MAEATLVWDARALLGEGPLWDEREQVLYWVDVDGHALHALWPATGEHATTAIAGRVSSVALRENGGMIAAHDRSVSMLDGNELTPIAQDFSPRARTNDGAVDPAGRYFVGTVAPDDEPGSGALYRLTPDGAIAQVLDGVHVSNGIDWSLDATTMYYADSLAHGVDAFDYDVATGAIDNRRRVAAVAEEDGVPDGLTVDLDGALWVAIWGGSCVRRYAPDGELLTEVRVPVTQPSSCIFGGPALDTLYVTSARVGLEREPQAGGLFAFEPGVRGRSAFRFAG